ncbi:PGPGW domain-containing protein [Cellulomonas endophytica]|uniref:PGPGW domain-containing protein n=1 Tax=Cellulomonas endophytica TaxID=2494735 RepID=UPI001012EEA9|nr:PGPGW domain-containing protein [Cellulomonas endophytica]
MRQVKRVVVTVVGLALLLLGVAMMVLPGPGILGIAAGLAVLATQYAWAQRLLGRAKVKAEEAQRSAVSSRLRTAATFTLAGCLAAVGGSMLLVEDVTWPVLDAQIDAVWGPVTGIVLLVSAAIVVTTTVIALRHVHRARVEDGTHGRTGARVPGAAAAAAAPGSSGATVRTAEVSRRSGPHQP